MEIIGRISEQFPLNERNYENPRTHQTEVFASVGFIIVSGYDSFYCEASGDFARKLAAQPLSKDYYYKIEAQLVNREYKDQSDRTRYFTDIRMKNIATL